MRALTVLALAALAGPALADQLITIPTGSKIPFRTVIGEIEYERSRGRTVETYLGVGIGKSFDMALRSERIEPGAAQGTFDVGYNYIAPIRGYGPGISVGVQDVLNRTRDGRRPYVAATFLEEVTGDGVGQTPIQITLGYYAGSVNALFVGVMLPFTDQFHVLVEHNGRRITAGFELRTKTPLALRLLFRDTDTLVGASYTFKF